MRHLLAAVVNQKHSSNEVLAARGVGRLLTFVSNQAYNASRPRPYTGGMVDASLRCDRLTSATTPLGTTFKNIAGGGATMMPLSESLRKNIMVLLFAGGVLAGVMIFGGSAAATTLSGLTQFSTDANGNAAGGQLWNTLGGDGIFNLYVAPGPIAANNAFVNHGNAALVSIDIPLAIGANTFSIFGEPGSDTGHAALNLFFNGNPNIPGISVFAATRTGALEPSFVANGGSTLALGAGGFVGVPGANTLSFVDGANTITLTDYFWATPSVNNLDRVSAFNDSPSGASDFIGQFTLTVSGPTQVPEPSTLALFGVGLVGVTVARKRQSK
jgi:PEP-CTERM motif